MPEHIRALMVILVLASTTFVVVKRSATIPMSTGEDDFDRRRNTWIALTLIAFLAHDFWVYIIGAAALLIFVVPRETNKLACFLFLLFAVPGIGRDIPGVGGINYLFKLDYVRLLALVILFPAYLALRAMPANERFGRFTADKLLAGYLLLNFALMLSVTTLTNSLRHGAFYPFIDVFLPYYVASRSVRTMERFKEVIGAFLVGGLVLALIGVFEFGKQWLLYSALEDALSTQWNYGNYLTRGTHLRAEASTGQAIALGYVMAVSVSLALFLRRYLARPVWWSAFLILCVGLIVPLSRGPWLGAAGALLAFAATGRGGVHRVTTVALLGLVAAPMLLVTPIANDIRDHLPFIGSIDEGTVSYRKLLLEVSITAILRSPILGVYDYVYSPAFQELRTGDGIIDIVNTYLGVALSSGLVGLSMFAGFFAVVMRNLLIAVNALPARAVDERLLGRALIAAMTAILITIFTVSSITVIPTIYWIVSGLSVSFAFIKRFEAKEALNNRRPDRAKVLARFA